MSETKQKEVVKTRFERAVELAGKHTLGELEVMVRLMKDVRHKAIISLVAVPTLLKLGSMIFPVFEFTHPITMWASVIVALLVCTIYSLFLFGCVYISICCVAAIDELATGRLALQLKKKEQEKST